MCRRVVQMQLRDSGQLTRLITDGRSCWWTGALGSQKHVGFRCLADELSEMRAKSPRRSPISRQLLMIPYCLPLSSLLCVDPAAICSAPCAPPRPIQGLKLVSGIDLGDLLTKSAPTHYEQASMSAAAPGVTVFLTALFSHAHTCAAISFACSRSCYAIYNAS